MTSPEVSGTSTRPGAELLRALPLGRRLSRHGYVAEDIGAVRRRAGQGDAVSMAELGGRLLIGREAPLDRDEGLGWLTAAGDRGDSDALGVLATLAGAGLLMPRDWTLALDYLVRAAALGSPDARTQLQLLAHAPPVGAAGGDHPSVWRALADRVDIEAWLTPPPRQPVCEAPRVRVAEGFAPGPVCDWLRGRAEGIMRPAMMYHADSKSEALDPHRTCSDYQFDVLNTDLVLVLVRERIAALTKMPTIAMEPPRIFHYARGEEIKPHYDRCNDAVAGYGKEGAYLGDRIVTFLLYLNDGFEGGELDFPQVGFRCKGAKGDGVYFAHVDAAGRPDPRSLHAGLPIRAGEKWVLSQWIHDRPFGVPEQPAAGGPGSPR